METKANEAAWISNDGGCQVVFAKPGAAFPLLAEHFSSACKCPPGSTIAITCGSSERARKEAAALVKALSAYTCITIASAVEHTPESSVKEALSEVQKKGVKGLVALGGGSAVGLAKSVALRLVLPFACIPTTYSGSEMTNIVGVTNNGVKTTSRDENGRARLVVYDPSFLTGLPRTVAVQSAFNAMAHAVEALWSAEAAPPTKLLAVQGVRSIVSGLRKLSSAPLIDACTELLYGSFLCGSVLNSATMGMHHKMAHILGGSFDLPHAGVHTVLLPHSIFFHRHAVPDAIAQIQQAVGGGEVWEVLWDLQRALGVPTSLRELGFKLTDLEGCASQAVAQASKGAYKYPRDIELTSITVYLEAAHHGRKPSSRVCHSPVSGTGVHAGLPLASLGAPLTQAHMVVVCLMGRYSSAERIMAQFEACCGIQHGSSKIAVLAPQAADSQWYPETFLSERKMNEPQYSSALSVVDSCVDLAARHVGASKVWLFGFSQGACLALSYAATTQRTLGGVIGVSGGLLGAEAELAGLYPLPRTTLKHVPVVMACAESDAHVPRKRVEASAELMRQLGAPVDLTIYPGSEHKIFPQTENKIRCILAKLLAEETNGTKDPYTYLAGYMGVLQSEALPDAVPKTQRIPREVKYNLIPECITGSSFTAPRTANLSTWLYRIHPTVGSHGAFERLAGETQIRADFCCPGQSFTPEPVRWFKTLDCENAKSQDFVEGLVTLAGTGNPAGLKGMAIHTYSCNKDMVNRAFYSADGDFLIVPEEGSLDIQTEFGRLLVGPGEVFILPRGLKITISLPSGHARGFAAELFEVGHFQLPNLGPLGSYGLADPRHFQVPTAAYEDRACPDYQLISKFQGELFMAKLQYSPYDVVGWSGRYHPCKYNLENFMAFGSVTWDHGDPSLHTVLNSPLDPATGASACDFVCFRPRWDAVSHTFRPPYWHRNLATEFNAIIKMATPYSGFNKGVHWLTPSMTGHGIAAASFNGFMNAPPSDDPHFISQDSIWIMFETAYPLILTDAGLNSPHRDTSYRAFWAGIPRTFSAPALPESQDKRISAADKEQPQKKAKT